MAMGGWIPHGKEGLRLLLVGSQRTGKSSSGNTLLGNGPPVFETRGGGVSAVAHAVVARRHVTVVDAQGWRSSSEDEEVPAEESLELLRALSLCGPWGPHAILLVVPLLDFTEAERRAVERGMEVLTPGAWRHTLVLFTFGDRLRARGQSVEQYIQSEGPALRWLMEKCRYRYVVLDNKMAAQALTQTHHQTLTLCCGPGQVGGNKKEMGKTPLKRGEKMEVQAEVKAEQRTPSQVTELVCEVEDMVLENGGWHFSLHMYQRMEEEWVRRERELRPRLRANAEREVEVVKGRWSGAGWGGVVEVKAPGGVGRQQRWRQHPRVMEECGARLAKRGGGGGGGGGDGRRINITLGEDSALHGEMRTLCHSVLATSSEEDEEVEEGEEAEESWDTDSDSGVERDECDVTARK